MPMMKGRDKGTISRNIAHLISKGHPKDQAVAIAYRLAGLSKDDKKKRG
jgi:hypothetical protein